MAKEEKTTPAKAPAETPATDGGLPLVSMILGILSLAMFMLFLGLPALILGIIGVKKYETNRAFSITGIVTGAISTLIMIGLILLLAFGFFAALMHPSSDWSDPADHRYYDGYDYRMDRGAREGA